MELFTGISSVLITLLILGILVFIHELGHFLAEKSVGVRVEKFAIGFGPKLWSKKIGETEYSLRLIFAGGFVQMYGDGDASSFSKDASLQKDPRSLQSKKLWQKIWVFSAGVIFNLVLAIILFTIYLGISGGIAFFPRIGEYNFSGAESYSPSIVLRPSENNTGGIVIAVNGEPTSNPVRIGELLEENYEQVVEVEVATELGISVQDIVLNGEGIRSNLDLDLTGDLFKTQEGQGRVVILSLGEESPLNSAQLSLISDADGVREDIDLGINPELGVDISNPEENGIVYVLAINDQQIYSIQTFSQLLEDNLGDEITMILNQNGITFNAVLQLPEEKNEDGSILGVTISVDDLGIRRDLVTLHYPNVLTAGFSHTLNVIGYNAYGLGSFIAEAFRGQPDNLVQNVGSVVAIGGQVNQVLNFAGEAGPQVLLQLINLAALISAVLAFLNILPVPLFDGGHIVFAVLESLRGKPLPEKVEQAIYTVFFGLLILLGVIVIVKDIVQLI